MVTEYIVVCFLYILYQILFVWDKCRKYKKYVVSTI